MIYIEPTPYILGWLHEVAKVSELPPDVVFIARDSTQKWGVNLDGLNAEVLESSLFPALTRLAAIILKGSYRIVHVAGWWGSPLLVAAQLLAIMSGALLTVESDTPLPGTLPTWKTALKRILYPLYFRLPAAFFPGGTLQAEYLRHYGVPDTKITAANMTVDVAEIRRRCEFRGESGRRTLRQGLGYRDEDVVVIFVGRLLSHKGVDDLLAAFEQSVMSCRELRLLIIGDGPERSRLEAASQDDGRITVMGRLDFDGVVEALHAADIGVVPSHFEPWGLVVNEMMAAALPVIVSDSVGCRSDLVVPGRNGAIYPTGDIADLSLHLTSLAASRNLRTIQGENSVSIIRAWTLKNMAERVVSAWRTIAS